MNKKLSLLLIVMIAVSFLMIAAAAVPLPPKIYVNHQTKECATMILGDECTDCFVPAGWEELGRYGDVTCPDGYTEIDLHPECQPFKISRCCSEGHSGAPGDCEDMAVNRFWHQCAFVDDINTISLPRGWQSKPDDVAVRDWVCPRNFMWQEEFLVTDDAQDDSLLPGWLITTLILTCLCGSSLLVIAVVILIIRRRKSKVSQ